MNKRDYLRSLGFEVGERGRFSAGMLEALSSFEEDSQISNRTLIQPQPRRPWRTYMLELEDGTRIQMGACYACKDACAWCDCDGGPQPPTYFDSPIASWYPEGSKEGALC